MLRIVEIYAVNQVNKAVQYYEKIEDNKLLSQKYYKGTLMFLDCYDINMAYV